MTAPEPVVHTAGGSDAVVPGCVVDCALYVDGVRRGGVRHYRDALRAAVEAGEGAFVWLGLREPTESDLADIATTFGLHPLAVEDAASTGQRAKIDRYEDLTFMVISTVRYCDPEEVTDTSEVVETGDVMAFVNKRFVITIRHGEALRLTGLRADLQRRPEVLARGPWAVAHALYDHAVDVYVQVAADVEEDLAAAEQWTFSAARGRDIAGLYQLKRELVEFRRAVTPLRGPLAALAGGEVPGIAKDVRRYFRDVADHHARVAEQITAFEELLSSVLLARLAQVTVEQNNDLRKVAAWAAIAAVQTAIAGLYGMNYRFMPELNWRYGYPLVLTVMIGAAVLLYRLFRRSRWL